MIYTDGRFLTIGPEGSIKELHEFAFSIGIKSEAFNTYGYPYYDIGGYKKKISYEKGAVKISTMEIIKRMRESSNKAHKKKRNG